MSFRALSLCVATLLLCGCGGGGSSSGGASSGPNPALAGPTNLTTTSYGDPMAISIQWVAPPETVTGYFLESRQGSGNFSQLNTAAIPAAYTQVYLTFNTTAPEDTDFGFRVYGVSGSTHTSYSNIATYHLGVFAPGQPTGAYDLDAAGVRLSWTRNTVVGDGLQVERASCDANGVVSGAWSSLSVTDPLAATYLDTTTTQGSYYIYRLTNLHGAVASPTSAVSAPIFAGFAGPAWVQAYWNYSGGGISVSWAGTSQTIDSTLIERCAANSSGLPSGTWTTVATAASGVTSYQDNNWIEGVGNFYRASYQHGALYSPATATTYAVWAPLRPPTGLQVTPIPGGFHLSWQNQSQAATQILINRSPSPLGNTTVAVLSPGVTSYDDTSITSLGYYTYQVVASTGSIQGTSASVTAGTPNPAGALALASTTLTVPDAADASIQSGGLWTFGTAQPFGILSNNDPWTAYFPNNAVQLPASFVQMDAQGHPHAIYLVIDPQDSTLKDLTHIWNDGTSWHSEVMAKGPVPYSSASPGYVFALDNAGVPQALVDGTAPSYPYGGSTTTLQYVHKVSGSWVTDSLAGLSPAINNIGSYHLSVDTAGAPHILLGDWSTIVEFSKDGTGAWAGTTLPTGSASAGWYDFLDGHWKDADNATVFFERNGNLSTPLMAIQKSGGTWQAPIQIGVRDFDGFTTTAGSTQSADGSRSVAFRVTDVGTKIYHQDATGNWHETLAAPPAAGRWFRIGIDGSNKVHLLNKNSGASGSGYVDYHE